MRKICLYIAFFCSLTAFSASYTPSSVPNPKQADSRNFVADPDHLLTREAIMSINQVAAALESQMEVELAVVAIEEMQASYPEQFALDLFNRWGVGKKGRNTGVMILLVTESRDIRIQTGGGMEGLLPDALCEQIIDQAMVPYLSNNQWSDGLLAGASAIYKELNTDAAKAELLLGFVPKSADVSNFLVGYFILSLLVLIVLACWVYRDTNQSPLLSERQRQQRAIGSWTLSKLCSIIFPLPVALLALWYYRHGGKAIQALQNEISAENERKHPRNSGGGFYIGPGFGGGHGGGFSGGSFGGGMSFGGGAGHKF